MTTIAPLNEKQFQGMVEQALRAGGWKVYHTFNSRRSEPGYPDIHAVHPMTGQSFFAELKMPKGKVSLAQRSWISSLMVAGHVVFVWRPEHWDEIVDVANGTIDLMNTG